MGAQPNRYWVTERWPEKTSLCAFFWRCFVFMPLALIAVMVLAVVVGYHAVIFIMANGRVVGVITGVVVTIGVVLFTLNHYDKQVTAFMMPKLRWLDKSTDKVIIGGIERVRVSVFWQGFKTIKGKVCPIITIGE